MNSDHLRVIKLGGSLLESADWAASFKQWLAELPPARSLLLVGGGPPVDAIRQMASLHVYDEEFLHWLCVDAMDISHRLVEQQLCWPSIDSATDLQSWLPSPSPSFALVHTNAFYRRDNYRQLPVDLPLSWDTTSDSLAALLAHVVGASELILIKSVAVHEPYDWQTLSQTGIVDKAFNDAMKNIPRVRIACLSLSRRALAPVPP